MTTILNGVIGGLVVALAALAALRVIGDDSSLTDARLGSVFTPGTDGARVARVSGLLLYGGLAGGGLIALDLYVLGLLGVPPTLGDAIGLAVGWSGCLFAASVIAWRLVPGLSGDRSSLGALLVFHLVYGLSFGIWIRLTWIT